jgi:DnaB helicase-like protein
MDPQKSTLFAHQIEQALLAAVFRVPERISAVKQQLDVERCIIDPVLRHIFEAIDLAYTHHSDADFATVIQILGEFDRLEACGGVEHVSELFEQYAWGFSSPEAAEKIIAHYIEMLRTYALGREEGKPVFKFNRIDVQLKPNKLKRSESAPDYIGSGMVAGKLYRAAAWKSEDGISVSLTPQ